MQRIPHLSPPDYSGFLSRNDPDDRRVGDLLPRDQTAPDGVRVVIVGVPQDIGVRRNGGRPGAAAGPSAFRTALARLTPFDLLADRSIDLGRVWDAGDILCDGELEEIHERLQGVVEMICRAGAIPLVVGGGHDITLPTLLGTSAVHGALGAVNVDAHLDVRPPSPTVNSGTSFRVAVERGAIDPARLVELGIQEFANAESHVRWVRDGGGVVASLEEVRSGGIDAALTRALDRAGSGPVYATLDLDAVRSAEAPGVSAPMPDGLEGRDLLAAARTFGADRRVVALDIAELNPAFDIDTRTARLAARAALAFVGGVVGVRG